MNEEFENMIEAPIEETVAAGATTHVETQEVVEIPDIAFAMSIPELRDAIQKKFGAISKEITEISAHRRILKFMKELYMPAVSAFRRIAQDVTVEDEEIRRLTCEIFVIGHAINFAISETGRGISEGDMDFQGAYVTRVRHLLMSAPVSANGSTNSANIFHYLEEDAKFLMETLPERFGPRYAIFSTSQAIEDLAAENPQDIINMIDSLSHDLNAVEFVTVVDTRQVTTLKRFFTR